MSETTEKKGGKKPLTLNRPGKLELNKTVETGQVRQSFSHGRTKSVTVEVKKKRSYARDESGRMTKVSEQAAAEEALAGADPANDAGLTAEELAARKRALESVDATAGSPAAAPEPEAVDVAAAETEAEVAAPEPETAAAEPEAAEVEAVPKAAPKTAPGDQTVDRRREADVEARRLAESQTKIQLTESKVRPRTTTRPTATPSPADIRRTRPDAEPADERRGARKGRGAEQPRRPGAGARRVEPKRRKLSVGDALDGGSPERQRSLAAVKRRREKEKQQSKEALQDGKKVIRDVVVPEAITVQELANRMAERGADVIKVLMNMGMMVTVTQTIDADTAELVVSEFGHRLRRTSDSDVEIGLEGRPDDPKDLKPRAPVVTIMGHVDHGKTSLLDALRETDVAGKEAGGITQHIGAYQVVLKSGAKITFLDTPGHEAFTAMRSRGAQATDIVVLVVAADDGIQPQTIEAINHAKAAAVPIIVAVNKIDRPDSDPGKVRNELLQHEIVPEEMGGEVQVVDVSAIEKTNLDKLEESILLQAEVLDLKANPERRARGVVIEAKLEKGRGPVATVLVQRGTLRVGDIFVAGAEWGKVRALIDDRGENVDEAGPSEPVEVLGLNGTPSAGDDFAVTEDEGRAREITGFRQREIKKKDAAAGGLGSIEQIFSQIKEGKAEELPMVVKTDVQGSLEAILGAAEKISTDEVAVRVLHSGVGGINESDVTLAGASNALVVGFNVRANPQARQAAEQNGVDIRYYSIIYDIIDDLKGMLSGMLAPSIRENHIGNAEIREVFNITKTGKVAGCFIVNGTVKRGAGVRLLRDDVVIHEGKLSTLKRFKEEVKDVREGYECGMAFENYQDIKVGDTIECFETEEVARTL